MAGGRRLISHLYRALRDDLPEETLKIQQRWDMLLDEPLTQNEWKRVHKGVQNVSTNTRFKLQYNLVHQVYLTPHTISKIYPSRVDEFPRCKQQGADFLQMIWSCGALFSYWEAVLKEILEITGWNITSNIKQAL